MHSRRLDGDLGDLRLDLRGLKQNLARSADDAAASLLGADMRAIVAMSPNAIEWVVGKEWCNAPETYEFQRSYQIIRDFFQLRCPVCNKGDGDLWMRPRSFLEAEVLLTWSWDALDYVCPKCRVTQAEFIENKKLKALNQLHMIAGQRCLPLHGSYVATDRGLLELVELVNPEAPSGVAQELRVALEDRHGPAVATSGVVTGYLPVVHVRTSRGFRLSSSPDHRYLVTRADLSEEWVRAEALRPGDVLKLRVGAERFGSVRLSEAEARLLGALVANGDVTDSYRVRFEHGHDDAAAAFVRDLKAVIQTHGLAASFHVVPRTRRRDRKSTLVEVSGISFVRWLRDRGLEPHGAREKRVPASVRRGTRETVCAFLSGYFSSDGGAYAGRPPKITCCSVSVQLITEIRLLLLNLGVLTNLWETATPGFRGRGYTGTTSYNLTVATESLRRFRDLVRFSSARKQRALDKACSRDVKKGLSDASGPPGSATDLMERLTAYDIAHGAYRDAAGRLYGRVCSTLLGAGYKQLYTACRQGQRVLGKAAAVELAERGVFLPDELRVALLRYGDPKYAFVRVVSVERDTTPVLMGDLGVPSSGSYVANGLVVHNSGKSITGALIGTYIEHALLSLAHLYPGGLHGYLDNMSPSVKFELTFVASNQVQTEDTIWALYTGFRERAPWFQRYSEWIKTQERYQVVRSGQRRWRYIEHQKVIVNEHPNVRLNVKALNSNSNGQAGRTRVGALIDEMARMKKTASAFGADEIYSTLEASLQTVRSRGRLSGGLPWLGPIVSVTSPMSRTDRAWTLYKQADDIPGMLAYRYATWDFNPKEPRSGFDVLMKKDPVLTMRNFGAWPPGAEHPYIHDERMFVRLAVDRAAVPTATFNYYEKTAPTGQRYIGVRLKNARANYSDPTPRYLVFDAGLNFDAFTGVCVHRETVLDEEGNETHITRFDWLFRIVPQPGTEALFGSVTELVKKIRDVYRIARVEFDRWNSAQPIQDINELGIPADTARLRREDFAAFRLAAFSGQLRMLPPPDEEVRLDAEGNWLLPFEWKVRQSVMSPAGVAIAELCELQQDPDTQDVYNPQKGEVRGEHSDDLARICVHAHRLAQTATFVKPGEQSRDARRRRVEAGAPNVPGRILRVPGKSRAGRGGGGYGGMT